MDHPRPLRHAADREAVAGDDRLLGARVGGHDRLGRVGAAVRRERRDRRLEAGEQLVQRQPGADHARREDEHLLGGQVEQPRGLGRGRERVELAALAGGGVGDAGVDHHRLRLGEREVLAVDLEAGGLDVVAGEHRPADRRLQRADDGEILAVTPADARRDARGDEAPGGGDAHTSTPWRRRPACRRQPEGEVGVLHRLPGGALAEVVEGADDDRGAGRAVAEDADLGDVGAVDARDLRLDPFRQHPDDVAAGVHRVQVHALDDLNPFQHNDRVAALVRVLGLDVARRELDEHVGQADLGIGMEHLDLHPAAQGQHVNVVLPLQVPAVRGVERLTHRVSFLGFAGAVTRRGGSRGPRPRRRVRWPCPARPPGPWTGCR